MKLSGQLNDAKINKKDNDHFTDVYTRIQNILHDSGIHATTIQPEIYDEESHKCKNIK